MQMRAKAYRRIVAGLVLTSGAPFAGAASASDLEYGKHLSAECTTCHKIDGSGGQQIPQITGWKAEEFIAIMKFYQTGARNNPAMVSVAQSLDEDQLMALALYFGSLPKGKKSE